MYWLWNKDVLFLALARLEINVFILSINKFIGSETLNAYGIPESFPLPPAPCPLPLGQR
jgi:hypothetical protein